MSEVLIDTEGSIRLLTLNRPEKLNAINDALSHALKSAIKEAASDDNVSVILLTGAGRAFSAGADLKEAASNGRRPQREALNSAINSTSVYNALIACDKPVIAAVNGYALGAGSAIAVSCDLVLASDDAVFGYPELKHGLAATAVSPTLVAQIGRKHATELLLLAENLPAARAAEIGLINRVVPKDELMTTAKLWANIMSGFDSDALWMTKRMIRRSSEMTLAQAHGLAADSLTVMRGF
ncbi:MAG: enoyl-CoA hydratase/isomerase family protein [Rhodospirillales bacterium]|jgi:enoyl-CoA hydratase/carnithine racemase